MQASLPDWKPVVLENEDKDAILGPQVLKRPSRGDIQPLHAKLQSIVEAEKLFSQSLGREVLPPCSSAEFVAEDAKIALGIMHLCLIV